MPQAARLQGCKAAADLPVSSFRLLRFPTPTNSFIAVLLRNAHHLIRWASLYSCLLITSRDRHPWLRNADSPRVNVANLQRSDESPKRPPEHRRQRNKRQKKRLLRLLLLLLPLQHRTRPSKLSNNHSPPRLKRGSLFRHSLRPSPRTCLSKNTNQSRKGMAFLPPLEIYLFSLPDTN